MVEIRYTKEDVNRMRRELESLKTYLDYLENNNVNGQYDVEIEATKNKISGLEYSLSGKN